MKLVLDNGEEFDLRHYVVRAAASVLERSPECHVSLERADRLAEQVLVAAAQAVARGANLPPDLSRATRATGLIYGRTPFPLRIDFRLAA